MPGNGILRIGDNAQVSQRVFDVGSLNEFEAATLDERNAASAEFQLQVERVETGTKQHGHIGERNFLFAQFQNLLCDKTRLVMLAFGLNQHRSHTLLSAGEQVLGIAFLGLQNDFVREVENRLGAAVVLLQFDNFRARKQHGKFQDVADSSPTKAINRLSIVANRHDIVMRARE